LSRDNAPLSGQRAGARARDAVKKAVSGEDREIRLTVPGRPVFAGSQAPVLKSSGLKVNGMLIMDFA
jgi:hypothetical protein